MKARVPTPLELALLGLIHQQSRSGYDLRKVFETTALGTYSSSPGAIYPALRRLESAGLVEGEVDHTKALRPKKIYRPSDRGTAVLRGWLSRKILREDVERRLDELMLRFAFHHLIGGDDETRRFLEGLLNEVEGYIEDLERQAAAFPEQVPLHPRLALAAGIEKYRACARWARSAIERFGGDRR